MNRHPLVKESIREMSNKAVRKTAKGKDVLKAPFPWFGGKSTVAPLLWERFGEVSNYVEPFFGSGAVLLGAPRIPGVETINDADGYVCNFWRAVSKDAREVASYADWPVNENDVHARHAYLVRARDDFTRRLEGDPDFYDARIAGWWVWGICCWIGGGWCSGKGPWMVNEARQLVHLGNKGQGVKRQLVHLGNKGQGVKRQLVHLNKGRGVNRKRVHLGNKGQGVNRKRVHLGNKGQGVNRKRVNLGSTGPGVRKNMSDNGLYGWFDHLQDRLRHVRVCCGDWSRVCGPTPTVKHGLTGVFLDPPYSEETARCLDIYAKDSGTIAHRVREWCLERGDDPLIRIALCGYDGEHNMPDTWDCVSWKAHGGYGSESKQHDNPNARRERIWFSPHCLSLVQTDLFK